ncbi:hypothetical protein TIFTF001_006465 [Ficus carica]|uniref:Uncharacterized protein n=1 Tax=Ficus carica TaxID=3494 RepID=A0AA87ZIY6_FICCA|nr:hypothetical protein TIFTF001_006465 [Ficus carica]
MIVDDGGRIGQDGPENELLPHFDGAGPFHRAISVGSLMRGSRVTYERIYYERI